MKKKFLIFTAATVAALLCLIGVAGCKAKAQTFEKAGMQITLTSDFVEKEIVSQTAYYESTTAILVALKQEFNYLGSNYTLNQYTNEVLRTNNYTATIQEREGQDYLYFTYEKTVSGKDYFYLATTHKSGDAYWLIQFACTVSNKDKFIDTFLKWADSIKFENPATDEVSGVNVGDDCPDFTLSVVYDNKGAYVDGNKQESFTISECKGKVTIINYWYSTSGPCVAEMPAFNKVKEEFGDEVIMVAVHAWGMETDSRIQEFIDETNSYKESWTDYSIMFALDTAQSYTTLGGNGSYPMTVILNAEGKITHIEQTTLTEYSLRSKINEAINS